MKLVFECFVRDTPGVLRTGRINSVKLIPFVGKKVKVIIKEVKGV